MLNQLGYFTVKIDWHLLPGPFDHPPLSLLVIESRKESFITLRGVFFAVFVLEHIWK